VVAGEELERRPEWLRGAGPRVDIGHRGAQLGVAGPAVGGVGAQDELVDAEHGAAEVQQVAGGRRRTQPADEVASLVDGGGGSAAEPVQQ